MHELIDIDQTFTLYISQQQNPIGGNQRYVGRDSMAVTQNETLFQILFTPFKDIPPKERDQMVFWPFTKYGHNTGMTVVCIVSLLQ